MNEVSFAIVGLLGGLIVGASGALVGGYATYTATKVGNKKNITGASLLTLMYMAMILIIASLFIANIIESLGAEYTHAVIVATSTIAIVLGLVHIRHYFWREPIVKLIHHKQFAKLHLIKSTHVLQPLMAATTLLYIVSPILVVQIVLMSIFSTLYSESALFWSMLYTLGVITPLYVITALVSTKTKVSQIVSWQQKTKGTTSLYMGLFTIVLSWIVLYAVIATGATSV